MTLPTERLVDRLRWQRDRKRRAKSRAAASRARRRAAVDPLGSRAARAQDSETAVVARTHVQRRRDRRVWLALGGGGVLAVAVFLGVFWPAMHARLDAAQQLDGAIALLDQASGTVGSIDKVVTAQLSPEAAPDAPGMSAETLVARRELNQASRLVADAMPHLADQEQHRAELVRTAVRARLAMIDRAPAIIIASTKAVRAKDAGDRGWDLLRRAEAAQEGATRSYQLQTASAVETASAAVTTIQGDLGEARTFFSQAATAFPEAGFPRYVAYANARLTESTQFKLACVAWLAGSEPLAKTLFDRYQSSARRSAKALARLPYAPGTATGKAFRAVAGSAQDAYESAKRQALQAEAALKAP